MGKQEPLNFERAVTLNTNYGKTTRLEKAATIKQVEPVELEARADSLAKKLGLSRTEAFKKIEDGTLPKTNNGVALRLVYHLLKDNAYVGGKEEWKRGKSVTSMDIASAYPVSTSKSDSFPNRPHHSKPAGQPRYEQHMDARTWLRANGYQDLAARIDRLMAQWKAENKKTRRDWFRVLAGSKEGVPSIVGGSPWPMLSAFRRREGYPVHSDAIERGPHELAPSIFAQKRWNGK